MTSKIRRVFLVLFCLTIVLIGRDSNAASFNLCIDDFSSNCPTSSTDAFPGTFLAGEDEIVWHFDVEGPIPISPFKRCRWNWEAFYPPAYVGQPTFEVIYETFEEEVTCVASSVTAPPGFSDNTEKVFCEVNDPDVSPPNVIFPNFSPSSAEIKLTFPVLGQPDDVTVTFVAGFAELFFVGVTDQCDLPSLPVMMPTNLVATVVPEPGQVVTLTSGALFLFGLHRRRTWSI